MKGFSSERARRFARVALAVTLLAALLVGVSATVAAAAEVSMPEVTFDPPIASFQVGTGQLPPSALTLKVTIGTLPPPAPPGYEVDWSFGTMPPWLSITPSGGKAPGTTTLNIAIDTTHPDLQSPGSYETSIPINVDVPVYPSSVRAFASAMEAGRMPVKVVVRTGTKITAAINPATPARSSTALPTTTAYGYLLNAKTNQALAGKPVYIWGSYNGTSWTNLGGTYTNSSGYFARKVAVPKKMYLRVRYNGDATYNTVTSATRTCLPYAYLTAPGVPSAVTKNVNFIYSGYVYPAHTSSYPVKLYFYRYEKLASGSYGWVYRKYVNGPKYSSTSTATRYVGKTSLPYAGTWRVRAVHSDTDHKASYSTYRVFTAK